MDYDEGLGTEFSPGYGANLECGWVLPPCSRVFQPVGDLPSC